MRCRVQSATQECKLLNESLSLTTEATLQPGRKERCASQTTAGTFECVRTPNLSDPTDVGSMFQNTPHREGFPSVNKNVALFTCSASSPLMC